MVSDEPGAGEPDEPHDPEPPEPTGPDPNLRKYATEKQWRKYCAIYEHGSIRAAAKALGVVRMGIFEARQGILRKAALAGYSPQHGLTRELPEGLTLKGTSVRYGEDGAVEQYWNKSQRQGRAPDDPTIVKLERAVVDRTATLYDQEGRVTQQWVRERQEEKDKLAAMREAVAEIVEPARARYEPKPPPDDVSSDVMPLIPVSDHHNGMMAWGAENGGADWDLRIAADMFCAAVGYLIDAAIPSRQMCIAVMGDFAHYDSMSAVTPMNRNLLDSDTRYPKMLASCVDILLWAGDRALKRHASLHWIFEIGNHDLVTTIFFMELFKRLYEREPRVSVDTSPRHFHYLEHGRTLLGFHHGHGVKMADMPLVMAHDVPEMWGRTEHRYVHLGHRHTNHRIEVPGCEVEQHNVLAARDAWADQKGWRPGRSMKMIQYDALTGEGVRVTARPGMFHTR